MIDYENMNKLSHFLDDKISSKNPLVKHKWLGDDILHT
jgi:hypothetical protein